MSEPKPRNRNSGKVRLYKNLTERLRTVEVKYGYRYLILAGFFSVLTLVPLLISASQASILKESSYLTRIFTLEVIFPTLLNVIIIGGILFFSIWLIYRRITLNPYYMIAVLLTIIVYVSVHAGLLFESVVRCVQSPVSFKLLGSLSSSESDSLEKLFDRPFIVIAFLLSSCIYLLAVSPAGVRKIIGRRHSLPSENFYAMYFLRSVLYRKPEAYLGYIVAYVLFIYAVVARTSDVDMFFIASTLIVVVAYIFLPFIEAYSEPQKNISFYTNHLVREYVGRCDRHLIVCGGGSLGRKIIKNLVMSEQDEVLCDGEFVLDDKMELSYVIRRIIVIEKEPTLLDCVVEDDVQPTHGLYQVWAEPIVDYRNNEKPNFTVCALAVAGNVMDQDTRNAGMFHKCKAIVSTIKHTDVALLLSSRYREKFNLLAVVESVAYDSIVSRMTDMPCFIFDPQYLECMAAAQVMMQRLSAENCALFHSSQGVVIIGKEKLLFYFIQQLFAALVSQMKRDEIGIIVSWFENRVTILTDEGVHERELRDQRSFATEGKWEGDKLRYMLLRTEHGEQSYACEITTKIVDIHNYYNYVHVVEAIRPHTIVIINDKPFKCADIYNKVIKAVRTKQERQNIHLISLSSSADKVTLTALQKLYASYLRQYRDEHYPSQIGNESRIVLDYVSSDISTSIIRMAFPQKGMSAERGDDAWTELNMLISEAPCAIIKVLSKLVNARLKEITPHVRPTFHSYMTYADNTLSDRYRFTAIASLSDSIVRDEQKDVLIVHAHGAKQYQPLRKKYITMMFEQDDIIRPDYENVKSRCPLINTNYPISTVLSHPEEYYKNQRDSMLVLQGEKNNSYGTGNMCSVAYARFAFIADGNNAVASLMNTLALLLFVEVDPAEGYDIEGRRYAGNLFCSVSRPTIGAGERPVAEDTMYIKISDLSDCMLNKNDAVNFMGRISLNQAVNTGDIGQMSWHSYAKELYSRQNVYTYILTRYCIDGADLESKELKLHLSEEIYRIYTIQSALTADAEKHASALIVILEAEKSEPIAVDHILSKYEIICDNKRNKWYHVMLLAYDRPYSVDKWLYGVLARRDYMENDHEVEALANVKMCYEYIFSSMDIMDNMVRTPKWEWGNDIIRILDL